MSAEHEQHLSILSMFKRKITETYIILRYVIIMIKFKDKFPLGNSKRIFESSFQIFLLINSLYKNLRVIQKGIMYTKVYIYIVYAYWNILQKPINYNKKIIIQLFYDINHLTNLLQYIVRYTFSL
jgi:hypothetical protein